MVIEGAVDLVKVSFGLVEEIYTNRSTILYLGTLQACKDSYVPRGLCCSSVAHIH